MVEKGIVIKSTGSWYTVRTEDDRIIECKIRGKFRTKGIKTTNPLAVGDQVEFMLDESTNQGVIGKRYDRKNYIIRKSINLSKQAHILAANVDQAILMVTLAYPKTYPEFIDRLLVSAEAYRIPALIVFNKIDLYSDDQLNELAILKSVYEKIGYQCIEVSAKQKIGIDIIADILADKISVIAGHSGIGKSTLINAIQPGLKLKTTEISEMHEAGKHTTTFPEMHYLNNGGYLIDTPGVKGFGVIDMDKEEIMHFFPEMFALLPECQYNNCIHTHEPKCAVKQAVEKGEISASRYKSYLSILNSEEDEKHRTVDY